ncbi:MAG: TolC family protein [bacterium]|nr:TolC family protein [bacterium]
MRVKSLIVIVVLVLLKGSTGWGFAGEIKRFGLKQVRDYAVKHSTTTTNARLDVAMARKKIWETTASGLPQISGNVSYQDMIKIPTTLIPAQFMDPDAEEGSFVGVKFGTQHNATLDITVDQLIFSGSFIVALQASKVYLRISQEGLVKSEVNVKENVTTTYYLILLAEDSLETLKASLENIKKNLGETKEMLKAGFVEDTDADQLQLAVTDLENSVKSMERQVRVTYRLLKFQMGFPLDEEIRLADNLGSIMERLNADALLKEPLNLENHIDFRLVDVQEKSQRLMMKREISEFLPTITAYATHSQSAMRNSFNFFKKTDDQWFPSTIVGVKIAVPIFSSGMRAAKVAQAKLELKKAVNTRNEVSKGLELELMQARSTFRDALEKADNTRKNVKLAKRIYEKTQTKYREGISSSLDLTQIHNQYLTAESNHTRAVVELLNAKTRMDKILSRL